jgi:hypothetical protein
MEKEPPVAKKTISKPGGGNVPAKSIKDNFIAGRFIAKALQRHLWESATCVSRQNRDFT